MLGSARPIGPTSRGRTPRRAGCCWEQARGHEHDVTDGKSGARDRPMTAINFLLRHVKRHPRLAAGVLSTIAAGASCAVAAQYGLKLLVDQMTTQSGSRHAPMLALALFLGLLGAESALWRLGGWLGSRAVIIMGEEIRLDLFEQVTRRSWAFFNAQASGALGSRIVTAATSGTAVLRTMIWNVLPPLTDLVGCVFVLMTIDWRIAGPAWCWSREPGTWGLHRLGQAGSPLHLAYHQPGGRRFRATCGRHRQYGPGPGLRGGAPRAGAAAQLIAAESQAHARSWLMLERLRVGHDAAFWLRHRGGPVRAVAGMEQGRHLDRQRRSREHADVAGADGLARTGVVAARHGAATRRRHRSAWTVRCMAQVRPRPAPNSTVGGASIEVRWVHNAPDRPHLSAPRDRPDIPPGSASASSGLPAPASPRCSGSSRASSPPTPARSCSMVGRSPRRWATARRTPSRS